MELWLCKGHLKWRCLSPMSTIKKRPRELDNYIWRLSTTLSCIPHKWANHLCSITIHHSDTNSTLWLKGIPINRISIFNMDGWDDFKRQIKKQFYLKNVAFLAYKSMKRLKHTRPISDHRKDFFMLILARDPKLNRKKDFFFFFLT